MPIFRGSKNSKQQKNTKIKASSDKENIDLYSEPPCLCVLPAKNYDALTGILSSNLDGRILAGDRRMVGILFIRPESSLVKIEILPHLKYFHYRSADHIDFICAGYRLFPWTRFNQESYPEIVANNALGFVDTEEWFSHKEFNNFREKFEKVSKWEYGGGAELILTTVEYDSEKNAIIDLSNSIVCNLDQLIKNNLIDSIENFLEDICKFSENTESNNPIWDFSDQYGIKIAGLTLKNYIFSLFPSKIGSGVDTATQLSVKNLSD